MKRVFYLVIGVVAFALIIITATGYIVGEDQQFEEVLVVDYLPENVWAVMTELDNFDRGKRDIEYVEVLGKYLNLYAWIEHTKSGGFRRYRQVEKIEDEKIVIEMTDSSYGVTGRWTFELLPVSSKTRVTIKESSKYTSILYRGFQFYFGLNKESRNWNKFIRVRLFNRLLTTP